MNEQSETRIIWCVEVAAAVFACLCAAALA